MLEGIFSAFFAWAFNSIWGWLGVGGTIIAIVLVVAWFVPQWRPTLLLIAGAVAAILFAYTKGSTDATRKADQRLVADEQQAAQDSRDALARARRDVANDPDGMSDDPNNRERDARKP